MSQFLACLKISEMNEATVYVRDHTKGISHMPDFQTGTWPMDSN